MGRRWATFERLEDRFRARQRTGRPLVDDVHSAIAGGTIGRAVCAIPPSAEQICIRFKR
jgi:hypothetical protein